MSNDFYERVAGAQDSVGGQYFLPGGYAVVINAVFFKENLESKTFSIIDTTVLLAKPTHVDPELIKPGENWPAPGERRSYTCPTAHPSTPGNMKNFFLALARTLYADKDEPARWAQEKEFIRAVYEDGLADGRVLYLNAFHTPQKKKPDEVYTKHAWSPYDDQLGPLPSDDEIAEMTPEEEETE